MALQNNRLVLYLSLKLKINYEKIASIIHFQQIFWILFIKITISGSRRELYRDICIREQMAAILKPFRVSFQLNHSNSKPYFCSGNYKRLFVTAFFWNIKFKV